MRFTSSLWWSLSGITTSQSLGFLSLVIWYKWASRRFCSRSCNSSETFINSLDSHQCHKYNKFPLKVWISNTLARSVLLVEDGHSVFSFFLFFCLEQTLSQKQRHVSRHLEIRNWRGWQGATGRPALLLPTQPSRRPQRPERWRSARARRPPFTRRTAGRGRVRTRRGAARRLGARKPAEPAVSGSGASLSR